MKLSQFANVVKADGFYLLHNTLYQTAISVSGEEAAFIDSISDYHSFEPDMNSNSYVHIGRPRAKAAPQEQ